MRAERCKGCEALNLKLQVLAGDAQAEISRLKKELRAVRNELDRLHKVMAVREKMRW